MIKPLQSLTLKNNDGEDTTYVVASAPAIVETTEPASVASFSDGAAGIPVESLIADINPVQNLNGQSSPYPAGGGKNLVAPFRDAEGTSSYGLTMTPNADGSVRVHGTASNSSAVLLSMKSVSIPLPAGTYTFDIGTTSSSNKVYGQVVTGAHIFFSRNAKDTFTVASDTTITRLDIGCNAANGEQIDVTIYPQLESGSSATTYAPYSNICPITGWTGMNVYRKGKNLIDDSIRYKTGNNYYIGSQNAYTIPLAAGTYTFSVDFLNGSHYGAFCKEENEPAGITIWGSGGTTSSATITLPAGNYMIWIYKSGGVPTADIGHVQLEVGSPSSAYEPYNGTTYPISWADEAGTVYGGTLDVTTGLLTVTHGIVEYDGSADESWTKGGGANECYIRNDAVKRLLDYRGQLFCDKLATYWHHETFVAQYGISAYGANNSYPSQNWLYVHLTDTTLTVDGLKSWLQSNPITVCYPLATPQTYQLTPQAVTTILGQNNIWADTGDVEVAYCADTKLYIDKVIAGL